MQNRKPLWRLITDELPKGYCFSSNDVSFIGMVNAFWDGDQSAKSIMEAVRAAITKANDLGHTDFLIDPWELFIDAGICDKDLNPLF